MLPKHSLEDYITKTGAIPKDNKKTPKGYQIDHNKYPIIYTSYSYDTHMTAKRAPDATQIETVVPSKSAVICIYHNGIQNIKKTFKMKPHNDTHWPTKITIYPKLMPQKIENSKNVKADPRD